MAACAIVCHNLMTFQGSMSYKKGYNNIIHQLWEKVPQKRLFIAERDNHMSKTSGNGWSVDTQPSNIVLYNIICMYERSDKESDY